MEVSVVFIIVAALVAIGVATGRQGKQLAIMQEGRSVVEDIIDRQRVHYANTGRFLPLANTPEDNELGRLQLGIDLRRNRYFRDYSVHLDGNNMLIVETRGVPRWASVGLVVRGFFNVEYNTITVQEVGLGAE